MSILPLGFLLLSTAASPLVAPQPGPALCDLVLAEERFERDDFERDVELALSEREAAGKIFDLVEALWNKQAIEEIVFLRARHDRDATRIDYDRAGHVLERKEASLEQVAAVCEAAEGGAKAAAARRRADKAFDRYRLASCKVLEDDERRAATDLTFSEALLASVLDLRANNVAAEQDVILAQREVEKASKRREQAHRRVGICREETKGLRPAG